MYPVNTLRVFHVKTTWKRSFPRYFNAEYMWCGCREPAEIINSNSQIFQTSK